MNKTAREAREEALRRHRAALDSIKKTCRTNMILGIIVSLTTGVVFGYNMPRGPMTLPPVDQIVVAYTDDQKYVAYLDSNGDFRSFSDGLPIGQVISWSDQE